MLTYQHILLATDLSLETDQIAATAQTLAQQSNATLSAVHVLEHTPVIYGGGEFSISLDTTFEEQLLQNAKQALSFLGTQFNIPLENQYISHGSVKREIIDLAHRLNVDLIVVGTHGHRGIELLLGATANAILHAATCDVLSVRIKETS